MFAWFLVVCYTTFLFSVYLFGLPHRNSRVAQEERFVSHGLCASLEKVDVYDVLYTEANVITFAGIMGLCVTFGLVLNNAYLEVVPSLFFVAAGVSDWLDGIACKRHDCHSIVGAYLDPIRDRLVMVLVGICIQKTTGLSSLTTLTPLFFVAIGELGVAYAAAKAVLRGRVLISHGMGKVRQLVHLCVAELVVVMCTTSSPHSEEVIAWSLILMAIASIATAIHYSRL